MRATKGLARRLGVVGIIGAMALGACGQKPAITQEELVALARIDGCGGSRKSGAVEKIFRGRRHVFR